MPKGELEAIPHTEAEKDKKMKTMRQSDDRRTENGGPACGQLFFLKES